MPEMKPQQYSRRVETIKGNPIAITSYKLGELFHCKAEIDVPGAGARIAEASDASRDVAEQKVLTQVRALLRA